MKRIITICAAFLMAASVFAQAPQKMSYQAIVRDGSNALVNNKSIGMRISILQGSATGTAVYVETQTPTSNANGLVSIEIGGGTIVSGNFSAINWANGPYFVKTETDPTGGTNYSITGTSQLLSVPYALYAEISGSSIPGPQGPQGAAGPQGPAGLLSNGNAAGNTPYWNGTTWVVNNSNIHNNGAGVGINTSSPNASAQLDVTSTTKGFLPPRLTTAQRDAIASPAAGLTIYNTTVNCLQWWNGTLWFDGCGNNSIVGSITALNCGSATNNGTLTSGTAASGVSSSVPYTGGNGGTHNGQSVASTGVTGLTATLTAGTFANGTGTLSYIITGTPNTSGTASFALNIGGQTCTLTTSVAAAAPTYPAGSVFCASGPTQIVPVLNPTTGKTWMDRNLGATRAATSSTDNLAYGDLYQWGRRSDGHQCRNSATTSTLSSVDQPTHGNFILAPNTPFDWRSPQNNNLWQGVNGVNNPCPSGYRLPTETELNAERLSWSSNNAAGAFATPLKLPLAGGRILSGGSLNGVGSHGYYWSSTVFGSSALYLYFLSGSNAYMLDFSRAYGMSVRCLKD